MNLATTGRAVLLLTALILAACGGGASTTATTDPTPTATCDPNDPATYDECGTVLIGFTDADGDFLHYAVDVISLTLDTANGRTVEVLSAIDALDSVLRVHGALIHTREFSQVACDLGGDHGDVANQPVADGVRRVLRVDRRSHLMHDLSGVHAGIDVHEGHADELRLPVHEWPEVGAPAAVVGGEAEMDVQESALEVAEDRLADDGGAVADHHLRIELPQLLL